MTINFRTFNATGSVVGQARTGLLQRLSLALQGMFNLNDSKWGRDGEKPTGDGADLPPSSQAQDDKPIQQQPRGGNKPNAGPPDLDELWRDFNKKLNGWLGGANHNRRVVFYGKCCRFYTAFIIQKERNNHKRI